MKNLMTTQVKRFNYLMNEIDTAYHEAALKLGLSDSASMILYTICNLGGSCLLSDIYGLSGISRQTLNSALRKLEKTASCPWRHRTARRRRYLLRIKAES